MKRAHQLTEAAVEKAKPADYRREIPDGGGLYLVVHSSGAKSWAVRYRRDGRPRKLTLAGTYPAIGLKAARALARKALEQVAHGTDPAATKIRARHLAGDRGTDFPAVVSEFLDRFLTRKKQRPRPRTLQQLAWVLGVEHDGVAWTPRKGGLADRWRHKKIAEITKGDILAILDGELARGVPVLANRTRAILRWLFSWCLRRDLVAVNPVAAVDPPAAEKKRDRVLDDSELRLFWQATGENRLLGPMWRLLALTGQRRDEARLMTWAELDLSACIWTIPAPRTKNGREHVVPLSGAALEILSKQPRIKGKRGLIFTTNGETGLGGLSGAKARLDARMLALAKEANPTAQIPGWVVHDLRRTAATGMAKLGVTIPVIEKILGHTSGVFAGIVGVYQRHDFLPEMRVALDAWGRHVETITTGKAASVVPIRRLP